MKIKKRTIWVYLKIYQIDYRMWVSSNRILDKKMGYGVSYDPIQELDIQGLRKRFIKFTRRAFHKLPRMVRPLILDIGCGEGIPTIELAKMSDGRIIGIDIDDKALIRLNSAIAESSLSSRITTLEGSFLENGLADEQFDLIWDEGTLHLLNPEKSFHEIHRILKPGGFLVMFETLIWLNGQIETYRQYRLKKRCRIGLPVGCWWTEYYAPLQKRIQELKKRNTDSTTIKKMKAIEKEIRMVKKNPGKFDCAFFILEKIGQTTGPGSEFNTRII